MKPDQNLTNVRIHFESTEQIEQLAACVCAGGKGCKSIEINENTDS
jgi:hypothetical protein